VDRWLLLEYRGLWGPDALAASGLSDQVKRYLREQLRARRFTRLLFIRRPDRRGRSGLAFFVADSREGSECVRYVELEAYEDVRHVELDDAGEPGGQSLFLVCTHGKHDPCCARYGRPLFEGLAEQVDEQWVWQTTHVGGDRFAGNLVCLPHGLYYGRVGRAEAAALLDEHLEGRIQLERYRGRSAYSFPVQAAERNVRDDEGLVGIAELTLRGTRREHDRLRVEFAGADGRRHVRDVFAEDGEPTFLTCGAAELRRPRRFISRPMEGRRS
jgi:hypothetical protein